MFSNCHVFICRYSQCRQIQPKSIEEWNFDESIVWYFEEPIKMATGGKLLNEGRAEKLLARILPEVSCTEDGDRNPSPPPFKVPDGLRTLLNELSKEV